MNNFDNASSGITPEISSEKNPDSVPEILSAQLAQSVREEIVEAIHESPAVEPVTIGVAPFAKRHPIFSAIMRGFAIILPPLLTVVIFIWLGVSIKNYIVSPIYHGAKAGLIFLTADIVPDSQLSAEARQWEITRRGAAYVRLAEGKYIPKDIFNAVKDDTTLRSLPMPRSAVAIYEHYFEMSYLEPQFFFPLVTLIFILILYLVGKLVSASLGKFVWNQAERGLDRVPLVRTVYGAVKQVVDFIFAERNVSFSRVVAVEWPRRGIWSLALVTSEGLQSIHKAAGEPVYSVLIPTSPMPMTGFTLHIKQSEVVELDITLDQALQFIVSCGVVIPHHEERK